MSGFEFALFSAGLLVVSYGWFSYGYRKGYRHGRHDEVLRLPDIFMGED